MKKLFEFVQHIGRYKVLVGTKDIANHAVTSEKIADGAINERTAAPNWIRKSHLANFYITLLEMLAQNTTIPLNEHTFVSMVGSMAELKHAVDSNKFFHVVYDGINYDATCQQKDGIYIVKADIEGDYITISFNMTDDGGFVSASLHVKSATQDGQETVTDITTVPYGEGNATSGSVAGGDESVEPGTTIDPGTVAPDAEEVHP